MILKARNKLAFGLLASSFSSNFIVDSQSATCPTDKTGVEGFVVNDPYYGTKTKCLYVIDGSQQWEALGLTWGEAQNYCYKNLKTSDKRYSGYLASIHTSTEAKQLQDKLLVAGTWWNFWIGLRQPCYNCDWRWDDISPIDFEAWNDGEPNDNGDGEDCVTVQSVDINNMPEQIHYGGWNDDHCNKKYSFVCELFPEGTPWSQQTITYPTTGGCKDGWLPFGGNCFNFGNALPGHRPSQNDLKDNYNEAQNTCNKMGGHLATPTNIYQMAFVAANSYSISQQFWLGIKSTSMQDKSFHWDGIQPEILTYSNWDSISPRGNSGNNKDRKCVGAHWGDAQTSGEFFIGQWRDYPCDDTNKDIYIGQSQHSYVCSTPYEPSGTKTYPNDYNCPSGWIPHKDSCYLWTGQKGSYQTALTTCQGYKNSLPELKEKHVGLPIVLNSYQNAMLFALFGSDLNNRMEQFDWTKPGLWLGLTVEPSKTGGSDGSGNTYQFKNWDGTHVTYSNWEDGQPDYEVLIETKKTACSGLDAYDGKWKIVMDFNQGGTPMPGIPSGCDTELNIVCEAKMDYTPPVDSNTSSNRGDYLDCPHSGTPSGGYCYNVHAYSVNFYDAEKRCNRDGGNLASIHSAAENTQIVDMVRSKIDADQYGRIFAWIGMHLVPGHLPGLENILGFEWSDQTQIEFTNWATGEPNNVDSNEGCGEIYSNGYWNDSPCSKEKNGFVCKAVRPTAYCSNDAIPTGPNDPDYRDKMSKLVPCGDFPTEDECVNVLDCCFNPELPLNCFKPVKNGKQASKHDGMSPGGASALTMFMMFLVFLPLAWFLFIRQ